jgi:alpha-tubulin suppressor-like RCC1 family protein
MRTTGFVNSSGEDLGFKFVDRDYLYSLYPSLPRGGLTLLGCGNNNNGQLGDNTNIYRNTLIQESTLSTNWKQVVSGNSSIENLFTAAIKTDGTLWLWGSNAQSQIGDNTTASRSTPRQEFTSSTNWKQVSGGYYHTAAIKTNGTLWLWGNNTDSSQLGDNTTVSRSTPIQEFTSSTNWKQVACGGFHTAAIKTDGTLWLWGRNASGQLGDNTTAYRSTPRQEFTSSTNWKQVSCGSLHTAVIKTDGTLWVWGNNGYGQIGDNTIATRSTPRQEFTSSTNWKQVSGGGSHMAAIKTDGTLWAWGGNTAGQIGDNTTTTRSTPRQEFTSSTNWKQVSSGGYHTAAIKNNGTLWVWGFNLYGQLGDNTNESRSTPRQEFTSSTNWIQTSCGGANTVSIEAPPFNE